MKAVGPFLHYSWLGCDTEDASRTLSISHKCCLDKYIRPYSVPESFHGLMMCSPFMNLLSISFGKLPMLKGNTMRIWHNFGDLLRKNRVSLLRHEAAIPLLFQRNRIGDKGDSYGFFRSFSYVVCIESWVLDCAGFSSNRIPVVLHFSLQELDVLNETHERVTVFW